MKQITLNIPENKYTFFLELIKNMPFIKIKNNIENKYLENYEIPESHKKIVRDRIKKSKKDDLLDWDQVKFKFN